MPMLLSDFTWATVHGIGQLFEFVKYWFSLYLHRLPSSLWKIENIHFLMLHETILQQKEQYSAFTVNIFWVKLEDICINLLMRRKKISNFSDSWVFQKYPVLRYHILDQQV